MHAQGFDPVAARVGRRDAWQVAQHVEDGSLVRRLLEVLAAVRVNVRRLVEERLRLDLLAVGVLGDDSCADARRARRLAHVVTVARLLDHVALLNLIRAWAHLDLFIADVVVVLVSLYFVLLVALARDARA